MMSGTTKGIHIISGRPVGEVRWAVIRDWPLTIKGRREGTVRAAHHLVYKATALLKTFQNSPKRQCRGNTGREEGPTTLPSLQGMEEAGTHRNEKQVLGTWVT